MYRPTRLALIALVATSFATVGLACSDATAPVASWLHGTYGLTTVLDSLTYSDYCSPPTSSTSLPICHDTTVANTTGLLQGTVTFGDTVQGTSQDIAVAITNAALRQVECESCAPSVRDYYSSTATVDRHKLTFKAHLLGGTVVDLDGSLTGPFITGRVTFFTYLGSCSQTYYSGRFVMKREP